VDRMAAMSPTKQSCEPRVPAPAALSLPVVSADGGEGHRPKGPRAPHSRMGWRRAAVLGAIQLLMIVHVVQWLWTGTTITPVEPSESMEAAKHGVITVGAIFFALALLSTAVLGRWFCGWGCHVVMLQDFCGYLMKRIGVRPRLFRSRLLLWLPLALAVYMFLWPVVYRIAVAPYTRPDLEWPGFSVHLTTTDFWATFPGVLMAVPFLLLCGFLTVYLLGAKGYCTYACPYGGFFAPLDELSPLRIRVSDACTQCGHCTAVCTSNVRVHEEVRDFRMVVDQGCMKCMDCVSACPEQALRVGWGTPAFLAKPVVDKPAARKWDLTWNEEIALAAVAVGSFLAFRGALSVPLLFASGIAACATGLAWILWRVVSQRDVRFHRAELKRAGRVTPKGAAIASACAGILACVAAVGAVNVQFALADFDHERTVVSPQVVFSGSGSKAEEDTRARAARGLARYERALAWASATRLDGFVRTGAELRMAWLDAVVGDYAAAERRLRACAEREGMSQDLAVSLVRVLRGAGDAGGSMAFARSQWAAHPEWGALREELINLLLAEEEFDEAYSIARRAVDASPGDFVARRRLAAMLVTSVNPVTVEEGLALVDSLVKEDPDNALLLLARATGFQKLQRFADAESELRRAIEMDPGDWRLHQALGDLLMATDRQKEAGPIMKRAGELRVKSLKR
jgi:Flp pilus assembly protein TadD/NAD-dependent dihydropyrimidine dehydrogenase PreA subunit